MNEVEYILRVILRARNELGRAFAAARKELDAFVKSANTADKDLENLNKRISSLNTRIGNSTKKVKEWQSAIRAFSGDLDKADKASAKSAKSLEAIAKESDTAAKKFVAQKRTQEDLHKSTKELGESFLKFSQDLDKTKRNRDDYVRDLKRIISEYEKLEKKTKFGTDQQKSFREAGNAARALLKELNDLTDAENKRSEAAKKGAATRAAKVAADKAEAAAAKALASRIAELTEEHKKLDLEARRGTISHDEHRAATQRLSGAYRSLANEYKVGSSEARKFGAESERLRAKHASLGRELRTTTSRVRALSDSHREGKRHADSYGTSIASLDNNLRGLGLLAAFAASQQLLTGLIGLGGQFVAVASSAAMAGTAIGGGVVAGVAQALPAVGLLTAALVRVKGVMDAVNQAQNLQKQQFAQGEKAGRAQADATDAIANAHDSLRDAQERVVEATKKVTEAQRDARRELEDMILAQKEASLAAKGAALSEEEARAALAKAVAEGGDVRRAQLELAEAELRTQGARREASRQTVDTRAAQRGGVAGMPGVQDAQRALQDAQQGVARAQRGLETASRNAKEAVAGTLTAQAQLDFLLSQLSPAERRLFDAVTNIQKLFRTTYRGITDSIIDSFTYATNRATEILKQPKVLEEARKLSREIGKSFRGLTDAFTSKPMVDQMLRITAAGRENLPTVTDIVEKLGKSFANIAEAASPALNKFLGFVSDLLTDFENLTGQRGKLTDFFLEGEKHLEAWVKLGLSVINFFAALSGAGGADAGLKSVEDATNAINDLTQKIRDNAEDVRKFFDDARGVTDEIIRVVVALGEELFKSFRPEHVKSLADFLIDVVIPAFGDIMRNVSTVSDAIIAILTTPGISDVTKMFIEMAAFATVSLTAGRGLKQMADNVKAISGVGRSAGAAIGGLGGRLTLGAQMGEAAGQAGKLTGTFKLLGPVLRVVGGAMRFAFGPWGLVIAGLITLIIALDKKFHFLEPTFKLIKNVASDVFEWLKHHWPLIAAILLGPFGIAIGQIVKHWDKIKSVTRSAFRAVKNIIGDVADWVWDKIRWLGRTLSGFLPGRFRRIGREAAEGLWDGIKSIGRFFANIGRWLFNHIIKPIYEFFEIKSPSGYFKRIGRMLVDGLVDGFKGLPNALFNALKGMGNLLMDVGKKVGEFIRKGIEKIPGGKILLSGIDKARGVLPFAAGGPVPGSGSGDVIPAMLTPGEHVWTAAEVQAAGGHAAMYALRAFFGGGTQSSGSGMANGGAPIPRPLGQSGLQDQAPAVEEDRKNIKRSNDQRARDWRVMWNDMVATARRGANDIEKQIRDMRVNGTNTLRRLRTDWSKVWGDTWQNVADFTYEALNYAGHETNLALTAFGAKHINFGLKSKDIKGGKAEGGWIGSPGERGRDRIPTWLGRGEAVLNWAHQRYIAPAVEAYYGHPFEKTFDRVHGFHAGGMGDAVGFAGGGLTGPAGSGAAFTAIANFAKQKFGLSMTAGRTNHGYTTSTGNVSDHSWGGAGDFSNGFHTPQENAFNTFWKTKAPQAVKQLIWEGKDQFRGFPISDHFDHVHLAVPRALAFDLPRMAKIISRASRGLDIGELMAGMTDSTGGTTVDHVEKLSIEGVPWAKTLMQKLTDKVIAAANAFIDKQAGKYVTDSGSTSMPLKPGGSAEKVFNYFIDRGLSEVVAAGIAGTFQKESNFDTSVTNRKGSGATGLAQWLGDRLTALHAFGGDDWNTLQTQLDFVWHELTGSERGALAAVKGAKTPEQAATIFDKTYERSDGLLSAPSFARAIFNAFEQHRSHFAEGGVVGGGDGTPVPIVAHAGEWVLNKTQQARAAMLAGLTPGGLKSMLGFWGGRGHFQGGGPAEQTTENVAPLTAADVKKVKDRILRAILSDVLANIKGVPAERLTESVKSLHDAIHDMADTFGSIRRHLNRARGKANRDLRNQVVQGFVEQMDKVIGENGLIDRMNKAIARTTSIAARRLIYSGRAGVGRFQISGRDAGGITVREQQNAEQQALAALREQQRQRPDLIEVQTQAKRALDRIRAMQKRGGLSEEMKQRLAGQETAAQTALDAARQGVADNVAAIYDAQVAYAEAIKASQQKQAEDIEKRYTTATTRLDRIGRLLDATGVVGQAAAGAVGISVGQTRQAVFGARGAAMGRALEETTLLRDQVAAQGNNNELVEELNDKIEELNVTIAENSAAAFAARVEDVNSRSGFDLTMNDLNKQVTELKGSIDGNIDQTKLLKLANDRQAILAQKGQDLLALQNETAPGSQQYNELAQALLENEVAMLQNTQAINELNGVMKEPQTFTSSAWSQFREAIFTGMGQVLPQYEFQSMQQGGHVIRGGLFNLHPGERVLSSSTNSTRGDTTFNFEINEAGGPVDLTALSSTVAFAAKTAQ
jgi:hypothetical protein